MHTPLLLFFFFNDTATTEIYTLSLHDALPIYPGFGLALAKAAPVTRKVFQAYFDVRNPADSPLTQMATVLAAANRSEEHTSELQSLAYLVCRLLLEKKKKHVRKDPRSPIEVCA